MRITPVSEVHWPGHGWWPSQGMRPERRRLTLGLLLSLMFHALLLSLTFGGQGPGLPGLGLPWQDRRIEAPDMSVVLLAAAAPAVAPVPTAAIERSVSVEPAMMTVVHAKPPTPPAPLAELTTTPIEPRANPKNLTRPDAPTPTPTPTPAPAPAPAPVPVPVPVPVTAPAEQPTESVPPPAPKEDVIALAQPAEATWSVPAAPMAPTPATAPAPSIPSPQTAIAPPRDTGNAEQARALELAKLDQARLDAQRKAEQLEAARQEAARNEAARVEATRQEADRQEAARQEAARAEVERQETTRQVAMRAEADRVEAARVEAARQEVARQVAARQDAARQEAVRQAATLAEAARGEAERREAARQAAARQEAARQEAAAAEAARGEAARQAAARIEAARLAALQAEAEKREERLRAIGRQLNEEADRRDAAAAAGRLSPAWSGGRRARLFGHTDANAELIAYAQDWSRKIQLNMTFAMVREAAKQPHTDPMVTVAIRSDGSVESVTFVRSSGVPAIDEAIRRVVHSQANYTAFPPGLAREYDVVEIRRTWHFDMAIRLY
ncbi:MAG: TonB C-terminal domain-containing protein [Rhodoferax sp.]|nr:TonB C-terminal domain-containing protein [Rhodoferax sp.]